MQVPNSGSRIRRRASAATGLDLQIDDRLVLDHHGPSSSAWRSIRSVINPLKAVARKSSRNTSALSRPRSLAL